MRSRSKTAAASLIFITSTLSAATLFGQTPASSLDRSTPLSASQCEAARTKGDSILDLGSDQSFERLRTLCLGTLAGPGVIEGHTLFVIRRLGPEPGAAEAIDRVDLVTDAVTRSHVPMEYLGLLRAAFDRVWILTSAGLLELAPSSLRIIRRYRGLAARNIVPLDRRLWFIDNGELKALAPTSGRISVARLRWLPSGWGPFALTSEGSELYLIATAQKGPESALAIYNPTTGLHHLVREPQL